MGCSCARIWIPRLVVVAMSIQFLSPTVASAEARVSPSIGEAGLTALASSGQWDPDDVEGRFDFRWVGAAYTSTGELHLSVSFYDKFRVRMLPRISEGPYPRHVSVRFSRSLFGTFWRQPGGHVVFEWGNLGCCKTLDVTRPAPKVFSVIISPCGYVHGHEIEMMRGQSMWRTHNIRARDRTREVELSQPNCPRRS